MNVKDNIRAINSLDWFKFVKYLMSGSIQFSKVRMFQICPQIKFDPIDISDRLKMLDGNKSIGPDNIHPYVLKQCAVSKSFVPLISNIN